MTIETRKKHTIGNALIWTALMLATAIILSDVPGLDDGKKTMLMILQIGGWFTTDRLVAGDRLSAREEWACIRSLFAGEKD